MKSKNSESDNTKAAAESAPAAASGDTATGGLDVVGLDVAAVEPQLGVTPEDVSLEEPSLATAKVSADTADAAELDAVAEEARRVAKEAEEAGRLAGGAPVPASIRGAATSSLEDKRDNDPDAETPAADDADKVNEGSTPEGGANTSEETMSPRQSPPRSRPAAHMAAGKAGLGGTGAGESGSGGTGSGWTPSSGSPSAAPTKQRPRGNHTAPTKTNFLPLILVGLAVLAGVALIIFIVVNLFRSDGGAAEAGTEGVIAEEVSPLDLQQGQCLQGFEDINSEVTVVTCDTPHNAQLVSTFTYPENAGYPGKDALRQKAAETCEGADLNADAIRKYDNLRQTEASPGETTWSNGDRRVDCYVFTDEPDALVESLLLG